MRTTFVNKLIDIARVDKRVYLITADLGFSIFEKFQQEFPDRFINVGIAESTMVGVAAGLAMSGKKVFIYSIIPFLTMRCFEQIRIDLCYQNLDVYLVGVGGGLSYGQAGATHHAIEDIAILRSLPNMKVICPGDPIETQKAIEKIVNNKGPAYIRLNRNGEPILLDEKNIDFEIGKAIEIKDGNDIALISTGNMLEEALEIAGGLENRGYSIKLISMHTIKPLDENKIIECIKKVKAMFTLEEHSIYGGLGSAVAEVIAKNIDKKIKFKVYGIPDKYVECVGDSKYFRNKYNIDEKSIIIDILNQLN